MNCWRKIADKFDMSPEEAEKKFKNIRTAYGQYLKKVKAFSTLFFFLGDHSDHKEITQSLGSPGSLNKFFSDPGDPSDPSDYMETGLNAAVPEITKKSTKFGVNVFRGKF